MACKNTYQCEDDLCKDLAKVHSGICGNMSTTHTPTQQQITNIANIISQQLVPALTNGTDQIMNMCYKNGWVNNPAMGHEASCPTFYSRLLINANGFQEELETSSWQKMGPPADYIYSALTQLLYYITTPSGQVSPSSPGSQSSSHRNMIIAGVVGGVLALVVLIVAIVLLYNRPSN